MSSQGTCSPPLQLVPKESSNFRALFFDNQKVTVIISFLRIYNATQFPNAFFTLGERLLKHPELRISSWAPWLMPEIPTLREADAGGSFGARRRPTWGTWRDPCPLNQPTNQPKKGVSDIFYI